MAKRDLPFSSYIAALVLAIAAPLVLLLGYFSYRDFEKSESQAETDVLRSAQLSAAHTAGFLRDSEDILRGLSQQPRLRVLDGRQCGSLLVVTNELLKHHVNVVTRTAAGNLVCTAVPPKAGVGPPLVSTRYLLSMLRSGKFTVGGPLRSSITGTWVVPLQYPLRDAQRRIAGAVVLALDLTKFHEIATSVALIQGMATRIITGDGIVIASSQNRETEIGRDARHTDLVGEVLTASDGTVHALDAGGVEHTYGIAGVPGTDWRVVAGTPAEAVFAQSRRDLLHNVLIITAFVALAATLSVFLARKVVKSVGNIAGAAAAVAAGDKTVRADPTGPIDIKAVATQFNNLLDVLDKAEQRLSGIIASAMDPIITINERHEITLVNAAVEQMFGYREEDLLGKPISMLIPERYHAAHAQHIENFSRSNLTNRAMGRFRQIVGRRADGGEFPIDASIAQMEWAGQQLFTVILRDITRRIEVEKALRASYELLDRIFATTHFCLVYLDRDLNFVRVNKAYADACGHPPEFFQGKNHFDLYPSEEVEAIFRNVVATGTPFTIYANPFQFPDHPEWGVTYWDWTLHPLRNEDGCVEGLLFALLDVTQRRRSEQTNAQLAAIVENSNAAIISRGSDRAILTWNAAAERLFGYTAAEAIGRNVSLLIPADQEARAAQGRALLEDGLPVSAYDAVRLGKDGRRIDVSIIASPIKDASGKMIGASIVFRDIGERKRAEAERAQLAAIVESSNDAILIRGPDRTILSWNAAAERLFGWSVQEAVGQCVDLIVPPERIGQLQPFIEGAARGESVSPVETTHLRKDGARIPTQITLSPVRDKQGNIIAHSYTVRDMSELKRKEEALRSYATRLRELSRRLREVEETERQAISRELHDRIGQDLSTLTLWFGKLAARLTKESPSAVQKQVEDMQSLLKSTVGNVRDVMAELRPPVLDDYGLHAALRQLATEFAKRSGISVELIGVDLQPRLPSIVETAMYRISQEALNNIAKHAQAKKVEISLSEVSERVVLDIADDGVGFDAGETRQDGQHWGMITMRERAEAVGITLRLESEPGAGTRVVLEVERAAS